MKMRHSASVYGIRLVAVLTALMGIGNILSAWFARGPGRLEILSSVLPLQVVHGSRTLAAVAGVFLVLTAKGLWRRKRRSWEFSIIILAASVVLHMAKGLDYEESLFSIILILLLIMLQPFFQVRSDPPSVGQGIRVTLGALLATILYGAVGFHLFDAQFSGRQTVQNDVRATLAVFFEFADIKVRPLTSRAKWFEESLYGVALLTLSYGFVCLTRPLVPRNKENTGARAEADAIVQRWGRTDIATFCLLDDKQYYFGKGREGFVAYKVIGNCAIALGDPIAAAEEVPGMIAGFVDYCQKNDWYPAFYQAMPDYLEVYHAAGLKSVKVGEDAIIDLETFNITGNQGAGFRHTINSLEKRQGVRAVRYDLSRDERGIVDELEEVSTEWLAMHHGAEKTFSLGYWEPERIARHPMIVALDESDRVLAFETLVPMYQSNGWAGDLMRRRPDSPRGVMDYLVIKQALLLRQEGYKVYGQGLSPLSTNEVEEDEDQGIIDRAVNLLYEHFNTFYGFKGLHDWKAKFHPRWESRYLVYPSTPMLPRIALAIIQADSTGGLLSFLRK